MTSNTSSGRYNTVIEKYWLVCAPSITSSLWNTINNLIEEWLYAHIQINTVQESGGNSTITRDTGGVNRLLEVKYRRIRHIFNLGSLNEIVSVRFEKFIKHLFRPPGLEWEIHYIDKSIGTPSLEQNALPNLWQQRCIIHVFKNCISSL